MADRYQDRPFPADDDYDRGAISMRLQARERSAGRTRAPDRPDRSVRHMGRANQPVQPRADARSTRYQEPRLTPSDDALPPGPPPGCSAPTAGSPPPQPHDDAPDYPSSVHPLQPLCRRQHCRARAGVSSTRRRHTPRPISTQPDPSRYDDALYGQLDAGEQDIQHDPAYPDDPYAYQDGYGEELEEPARSAAAA